MLKYNKNKHFSRLYYLFIKTFYDTSTLITTFDKILKITPRFILDSGNLFVFNASRVKPYTI